MARMDKLLIAAACLLLGALVASVSANPTGHDDDPVTPAGPQMDICIDNIYAVNQRFWRIEACDEIHETLREFEAVYEKCKNLDGFIGKIEIPVLQYEMLWMEAVSKCRKEFASDQSAVKSEEKLEDIDGQEDGLSFEPVGRDRVTCLRKFGEEISRFPNVSTCKSLLYFIDRLEKDFRDCEEFIGFGDSSTKQLSDHKFTLDDIERCLREQKSADTGHGDISLHSPEVQDTI